MAENAAKPVNDSATERLRSSYRPDNVRLLLVGESPPAGGKFFYDDRSRVPLRTHTIKVFSDALNLSFNSDREFLNWFKKAGC